jgi:hippurate hydrolase
LAAWKTREGSSDLTTHLDAEAAETRAIRVLQEHRMNASQKDPLDRLLSGLTDLLPTLEAAYKDVHAHPELSMQETRTAGIAARHLSENGYDVTAGIGKTGVVGLLRNGDGPTIMLRADMDALPIREASGVDYASTASMTDSLGKSVPTAHACGHDMHVAWLIGTSTLFARTRDAWKGTLLVLFQPGEETAQGARAMIGDGLFTRFPKPDVVLGQHVMVGAAGTVAGSAGPITSAADSLQIRLFGRGAHGSMPQASIDPIVMAASTVLRLQTIVSREIAATDAAVLTIGVLQAGTKENVIPDEALIKLNLRTFDTGVRKRMLDAIERIVRAEAQASGAPRAPEITPLDQYPLNVNDKVASERVAAAFRAYFSADRVRHTGPAPASEDFGCFGTEWHAPSVFWFVGGTDPGIYEKAKKEGRVNELPVNHSPKFVPVLHPTLRTGVEAMVTAAMAWNKA